MGQGRDVGRTHDGTRVNECCSLVELGRVLAGGRQLRPPNMEAGRRHRFIPAEGGDGLAALRMPEQAAMPGGLLRGMRF